MTTPRGIGTLRPFPFQDAKRQNWPQGMVQWMEDVRTAVSSEGAFVKERFEYEGDETLPQTAWSYEVPRQSVVIFMVYVVGITGYTNDRCAFRSSGVWYRHTTGNTVYQSVSDDVLYRSNATLNMTPSTLVYDGTIRVTGISGDLWKWLGHIEYMTLRA